MSTLRVGILFCQDSPDSAVQFLDTAAIDLFGAITPAFLAECKFPKEVIGSGQDFEFRYISEGREGTSVFLTSGMRCVATDSLESAGRIDLLVIPGPSTSYVPSQDMQNFIRQAFEGAKSVLTICTGIFPLMRTDGIPDRLKGTAATATRMFLPQLREEFPHIHWTEKRWEHEGKLWSSGGIVNGIDMIAAFIRENYPPEVAAVIRDIVEVEERPQEYPAKEKASS